MKHERIQEIRTIISNLRAADNGEEMAPRLLSDAVYALLELLDEVKQTMPPPGYFDDDLDTAMDELDDIIEEPEPEVVTEIAGIKVGDKVVHKYNRPDLVEEVVALQDGMIGVKCSNGSIAYDVPEHWTKIMTRERLKEALSIAKAGKEFITNQADIGAGWLGWNKEPYMQYYELNHKLRIELTNLPADYLDRVVPHKRVVQPFIDAGFKVEHIGNNEYEVDEAN